MYETNKLKIMSKLLKDECLKASNNNKNEINLSNYFHKMAAFLEEFEIFLENYFQK